MPGCERCGQPWDDQEAVIHVYIAYLKSQIDEARDAIRKWCELTQIMGTHRSCRCKACEELHKYIADIDSRHGGEEEKQ